MGRFVAGDPNRLISAFAKGDDFSSATCERGCDEHHWYISRARLPFLESHPLEAM